MMASMNAKKEDCTAELTDALLASVGKMQGYEYTSDAPAAGAHVSAPAEVDWTLHDEGAYFPKQGLFH